jgi:hypothetical protein
MFAQDAFDRAASMLGDRVEYRLPSVGDGQRDISSIGGILAAVKQSRPHQSVADPTGIRRTDLQAGRHGGEIQRAPG